jgi:hemolysin activation/secretion protein
LLITLQEHFNSVFTGGDLIRLQGSFVDPDNSPNQRSVYGSYTYPLTLSGTYVEVSAGDFQTEVPVEGSSSVITTNTGFSILPGAVSRHDFEGQSASVTVGHPFIRTHGQAAYVLGSVDWSDDETETVGDTENISGDVSIFYRHERSDGRSYAVGMTLGIGHTESYHAGETGNFGYLQGSLGGMAPIEAIAPHTETRFEIFCQLSTNYIPSAKMIGLGSEEFLRGYDNSTFIGASGIRGSIELAHSFYPSAVAINSITPLAFVDFGAVRNDARKATSASRPIADSLASTGVGIRMSVFDHASVESFVGLPLMENALDETPGPRVYLRLSWGW